MRRIVERRQNLFVGKFPAVEPFNQVAPDPSTLCHIDFLPAGIARQCVGYFPELEQLSLPNRLMGFRKPREPYSLR
jgi:hypothetical protein